MSQGRSARRRLEWIHQWPPGDAIVWIDVTKLNAAWRRERGYYISVRGRGSRYKYTRFGQWLGTAIGPIWMWHIGIDDQSGQVGFTDGRHRFAWLRDHGVLALPITCEPEQATEIRQRFGTRKRASWLALN